MELVHGSCVGPYQVIRLMGRGGMGAVYEAEHLRLRVRHAVKVFPLEGESGDFLRKRFLAEGKLLSRLQIPGVVHVYDMGSTEDYIWFAMDCIKGPDGEPHTLADAPEGGETPEQRIIVWYEDLRRALAAIHAAGIVHRDIKLENAYLNAEGHAVLGDFGISRIQDDRLREELSVTRTMMSADAGGRKVVMGTIAYLAPEFRSGGEATPATDYYALGVAFFRLLTGIWYEPGPRIFDLLQPFDARWKIVLKALLATEPADRAALPFEGNMSGRGKVRTRWAVVVAGMFLSMAVAFMFWRGSCVPKTIEAVASAKTEVPAVTPKVDLPRMVVHLAKTSPIEFVQCPAGSFTMGKDFADQIKPLITEDKPLFSRYSAQVRKVTISRPFWMARTPITWGQYKALTGATNWNVAGIARVMGVNWENRGEAIEALGGDQTIFTGHPNNVAQLVKVMNRQYKSSLPEGMVFRLASEAEWEYALRAGVTGCQNPFVKFPVLADKTLGESWKPRVDFLEARGLLPAGVPLGTALAGYCPAGLAGKGTPNAWGIYDFRTVDEWVLDTIFVPKSATTPAARLAYLYAADRKHPDDEVDPLKWVEDGDYPEVHNLMRVSGRGFTSDSWSSRMRWSGFAGFCAIRLVIGPDLVYERRQKTSGK